MAVFAALGAAVMADVGVVTGDYDVINALLKNFTVAIPDQVVPLKVGTLTLSKMVVSNMEVDTLDIDKVAFADSKATYSIDLAVKAQVAAHYHYGIVKGDMALETTSPWGVKALVDFTPPKGKPLSTSDATAAVIHSMKLTFGSAECKSPHLLSDALPEWLCNILVSVIEGQANKHATEVVQGLSKNVTEALEGLATKTAAFEKARKSAAQLASEQEAPYRGLAANPDIVNFRNGSAAGVIDFVFNRVYGKQTAPPPNANTALGEMLQQRLFAKPIVLAKPQPLLTNQYANVTLHGVEVTNLRAPSFSLKAAGDFSLSLALSLRGMDVNATAGLALASHGGGYYYASNSSFMLKNTDVDLEFSVMVVANATNYGQLPLSSLLPLPDSGSMLQWLLFKVLPCWIEAPVLGLNISSASVRLLNYELSDVFISQGLSADVAVLGNAAEALVGNGLNGLLGGFINEKLNWADTLANSTLTHLPVNECAVERYPQSNRTASPAMSMNYTSSDLLRLLDFAINDVVGDEGPYGVDGFIAVGLGEVTLDKSFSLTIPGHLGTVAGRVSNLRFETMPDVANMSLLRGASASELASELAVAGMNASVDVEFRVFGENQQPFQDTFRVFVGFGRMAFADLLFAPLDASRFLMSPLGELGSPGCAAGELDSLGFPNTTATVDGFRVGFECLSCDSPKLSTLTETLASAAGAAQIQAAVAVALGQLDTILNKPVTTSFVRKTLAAQREECDTEVPITPAPPAKKDSADSMTVPKAYAVIFGLAGGFGVILFVYTVFAWRRESARMKAERGTSRLTRSEDMPLVMHPSIDWRVRWFVVFMILGTTAMFLSSNITPVGMGAVVHAHVSVGGSLVKVNDIFAYALGNTVADMWNAKVYFLSLLICLLSGVWPYSKMVGLMWLWVVPPCVLSPQRREKLLCLFDFCGKWSLIDSFMTMMMMCAFRLHINLPPDWDFVQEDVVVFDIIVTPFWGLFGFMTAAILSLSVNHAMVVYHRESVMYDETGGAAKNWFDNLSDGDTEVASQRLALYSHSPDEGETPEEVARNKRRSHYMSAGSIGLLVLSLGLLLTGVCVHTFEFEVQGLAGLGKDLDLGAGANKKQYSMLRLAKDVMDQANDGRETAEYSYLVAMFLMFSVIVPILQIIALIVLWVAPLTLREQKILYFTNEVIAAWSALEVFVLVLIATMAEIEQFVKFLIGDGCDQINAVLADVVQPLGYLQEMKPVCFDVKAELVMGCWFLFAATLASNIAYSVAHSSAAKLIESRTAAMEAALPLLREEDAEKDPRSDAEEEDDEGEAFAIRGINNSQGSSDSAARDVASPHAA